MRKKNIAIMILTALALSTTVQAAPTEELDEYALDTVIVTATRTSENIKNVPANVTVITAKDLEKKQIFSVREALQNEVGFIYHQRRKRKTAYHYVDLAVKIFLFYMTVNKLIPLLTVVSPGIPFR